VCFNSTLFPVPSSSSTMAKTKYSGEKKSAKVAQSQHLFFGSGNAANSEELRSGDIGDVTRIHREETLYNPIHTALSQSEFSSSTESRRPTRSMVRPSRYRDAAFETQFQPGREKKTRTVYRRPGRGDFRGVSAVNEVCKFDRKQQKEQQRNLYSGREDQMKMNKDVSKQPGQTNGSLTEHCNGKRPELSWRSEPKRRWSTRPKTRFKKCKWSQWKIRFKSGELQYDSASSSKPLLDVIQLAGAQEPTHYGQSCRKQTAQSSNMAGI